VIQALFICSRNRLRSPTAEAIFARWPGVESDSAGLGSDADVPLSSDSRSMRQQWLGKRMCPATHHHLSL